MCVCLCVVHMCFYLVTITVCTVWLCFSFSVMFYCFGLEGFVDIPGSIYFIRKSLKLVG